MQTETLIATLECIDRVLQSSDPTKYSTTDLECRIGTARVLIARFRGILQKEGVK